MKAVVLAGGVRSGSEVPGSGVPRALWPFPSKPLISHVLQFLREAGCRDIAICANGKTRMIAGVLSSGAEPWKDLHYSEDPLPRGPAGCLRDLKEWLGDETFVAIQGTAHYDFDLASMVEEHRKSEAAITVGARACADDVGELEPVGVYLVEPRTLELIQAVGFQDFKEQFLPKVIESGLSVRCHVLRGAATLIHSPNHYLSAIHDAILRAAKELPAGYVERSPGVVVHETATVHPTARLNGPVWIDAGSVVEEYSVLAGPVVLGPRSRVKSHALVHCTVAMRDNTIATAAEVHHAILPPQAQRAAQPTAAIGSASESAALMKPQVGVLRQHLERFLSLFGTARSVAQ